VRDCVALARSNGGEAENDLCGILALTEKPGQARICTARPGGRASFPDPWLIARWHPGEFKARRSPQTASRPRRNQSRSSRIASGKDGSMSPEAKLSWMIAGIGVALFVLIMAWLFTAVEKNGSLVKDAHHHTPDTTHP
jgi:hypothetical protein